MRDGPLRSSTLFHLSLEVSTASGSQSMQKKFIVTGGAGFIGSAVARNLSRGNRLQCRLDRSRSADRSRIATGEQQLRTIPDPRGNNGLTCRKRAAGSLSWRRGDALQGDSPSAYARQGVHVPQAAACERAAVECRTASANLPSAYIARTLSGRSRLDGHACAAKSAMRRGRRRRSCDDSARSRRRAERLVSPGRSDSMMPCEARCGADRA